MILYPLDRILCRVCVFVWDTHVHPAGAKSDASCLFPAACASDDRLVNTMQALLQRNQQLAAAVQSLQREYTAWEAASASQRAAAQPATPTLQPDRNAATPQGTDLPAHSDGAPVTAMTTSQPHHALDNEALVGMVAELRRQLRRCQRRCRELERTAHAAESASAQAAADARASCTGEQSAAAAAVAQAEASRLRLRTCELEQRALAAERSAERARGRAKGGAQRAATLESELAIALACLRKWEALDAGGAEAQTRPCSVCTARLGRQQAVSCQTDLLIRPPTDNSGALASKQSTMDALLQAAEHVCMHKKLTSAFRRCVAAARTAADDAADAPDAATADQSSFDASKVQSAVVEIVAVATGASADAQALRVAAVHVLVSLQETQRTWQQAQRHAKQSAHGDMAKALEMLTSLAEAAATARASRDAARIRWQLPNGAPSDAVHAAAAARQRLERCEQLHSELLRESDSKRPGSCAAAAGLQRSVQSSVALMRAATAQRVREAMQGVLQR